MKTTLPGGGTLFYANISYISVIRNNAKQDNLGFNIYVAGGILWIEGKGTTNKHRKKLEDLREFLIEQTANFWANQWKGK